MSCLFLDFANLPSLWFRTHRMQDQYRQESPSDGAHLCEREASGGHRCCRITVPMTIAEQADRHRDHCILDPCRDRTSRANMFEEQQTASRLEYPPDLAQATLWLTYRTENERCYRAVEMCIGERERLGSRIC